MAISRNNSTIYGWLHRLASAADGKYGTGCVGNDFVSGVLLDARGHARYSVQPSNSENDEIRATLPGGFKDLCGRLTMQHLRSRAASQVNFRWNKRF